MRSHLNVAYAHRALPRGWHGIGTWAGDEEEEDLRAKPVFQRRVRQKLRVARGRCVGGERPGNTRSAVHAEMTTSNPSGKGTEAAFAIATACNTAARGFDLCARRTQDETIAVAARNAAAFLRLLCDATVDAAAARGIDIRLQARTCDCLRWEWLASTAAVVDGSPDVRLLSECARIVVGVDVSGASDLGHGIAARLQIASAEARSLALAVVRLGEGAVALRTAFKGGARRDLFVFPYG